MKERILKLILACFERLQTLQIQSGLENMERLLQTLYDLREVYQELNGGDGDAGSEGRDSD